MKTLTLAIALFCLVAAAATAAQIDGKWVGEIKMQPGKKGGGERTATFALDLKSSGSTLTGSVSADTGRRARPAEIKDGKIDGNAFSFTTVQTSRKGEQKWSWRGTVEGEELKCTRTREGGRGGMSFTAKRK